jgi:hypothetical protein
MHANVASTTLVLSVNEDGKKKTGEGGEKKLLGPASNTHLRSMNSLSFSVGKKSITAGKNGMNTPIILLLTAGSW